MFEAVSGGDIAVKEVVTVGDPASGAELGVADQIWRWNTSSSSWTKYFYYKKRTDGPRWVISTDTTVETTDTIPAGETFFFLRASGASTTSLTLAGGVKDLTGTKSFTVNADQLAFASNPWPMALNIKDFTSFYTSGEAASGSEIGVADQIWLWNTASSSWTKYFYYKKRTDGPRWVISTDATTETTDTIGVGVGFFFQRASGASSATITFSNGNE